MGIEGEETKRVIPALEFLRDVNLSNPVELDERIVVIGGGNAAIDAARVALRLGVQDVTILLEQIRLLKLLPLAIEPLWQLINT